MRPRVFPAERHARRRTHARRAGQASMRPRVFPAEDGMMGGRQEQLSALLQ